MRIIISQSTQEAVETVALMVKDKVLSHPNAVLGLATGKTMGPVYAELAKSENAIFSKCFFFMLDEYLSLPENHPSSFKAYIKTHLQLPLKLAESQFAFPPVHLKNLTEAGIYYEQSIKESQGIDLQLLGIGQNGHIGFNEPGSSKESRTRIVHLTEETRRANQDHFGKEEMPREALSMGIASILDSKSIVMLATGKSKSDAIKYLMNHHDDPICPATYLKSHPHFILVLDPDAASKINLNI
jgi:glucosamine-6-phosphate deaminase